MSLNTDEDQNKLSIISRFMRTIRDMQSYEPLINILDHVNEHNEIPNKSLKYKSPYEITEEDELENIDKMRDQINHYKFKSGESVRIILNANIFVKKQRN